jgi:trehalose 6-phosphate synthase/phosphatase
VHSIACHTLPYTCSLVPEEEPAAASVELRRGGHSGLGVHVEQPNEEVEKPVKPASAIPVQLHNLPISTPKSILMSNPFDDPANLPKNTSFMSAMTQQKHFTAKQKKNRWFLTARHGHAALNAGIRALAADGDVTLVAWPGDMRHGIPAGPDEEDQGDVKHDDLTDDLKRELDQGLAALGGTGKGPRCRAVWLSDKTSRLFYDGYCKTFLWPTFHYFVRAFVSSDAD